MRSIDVTPYLSNLDRLDPKTGEPTGEKLPIKVRESLVALLFAAAPADPLEFLRKAKFADRLDVGTEAVVTIEEHEWEWLKAGLRVSGIKARHFVELVRRVVEAQEVQPHHDPH